MAQKPSIPKGTRDFSPQEMVRRNYIFDTIKLVFQRYGYLPIETPAMENLETLTGKYGDEGDKLIYKIRSNKNLLEKYPTLRDCNCLKTVYNYDWIPMASDKALRYDLTVPFARYVVQHQNEITFPFKRYQIQPVWRADNPQKGRYREFFQCDADVIGSNSLINEVELTQMIDDVFTTLNVPVVIKINNRKILSGIAEIVGAADKMIDIATAIDKYDKIGDVGVNKELSEKGFSNEQIEKLEQVFLATSDRIILGPGYDGKDKNLVRLELLREHQEYRSSEIFLEGVKELEAVFKTIIDLGLTSANVEFDITLARGLNYYTGAIFEVKANKGTLTSSICGGGRYDDLTGIFGLPNMSGVGISFGADRIYDVLNELDLYPDTVSASTKLLFVTFGKDEQNYCLPLLAKVRKAGINSEIYPDANAKMKKQMSYADDKKISFVVIVGGDEMASGELTLKNMTSGKQEKIKIEKIIEKLK